MTMIDRLLTDAERRRFTEYLQHESKVARRIAQQADRLPGDRNKAVAETERVYADACELTSKKLSW